MMDLLFSNLISSVVNGSWEEFSKFSQEKDGRVRAAKIKTNQGACTTKLCVLEESKKMDHRRPNWIETNDGEE
jgi:hypothetical protein